MDASSQTVLAELALDEIGRGLWEPALPHLDRALLGDETQFLAVIEEVARGAGLSQCIPVADLLDALRDGSEKLGQRLATSSGPAGESGVRRLQAVERVALTRVAAGYSAGLEETIAQLRCEAAQSSPLDEATGAVKPNELVERLSLEINRCQRMDLSLGLVELAVMHREDSDFCPAAALGGALSEIGACLRENLRRYDSVGLTSDGAFLMVLPDTSHRGLAGVAERVRREIGQALGAAAQADFVIALAHYDVVDRSAKEMLGDLRRGVAHARTEHLLLLWA